MDNKGYVLIDLVVAMLLLTIVMGMFALNLSFVLENHSDNVEYMESYDLLNNRLAELYDEDWSIVSNETLGDMDLNYTHSTTIYNTELLTIDVTLNTLTYQYVLERRLSR